MISPRLRVIAFVLLILSLAMFTGIATTVSALERPESVDACCDRGETEQEPMSGPCADANCLCFSCLTLDRVAPLSCVWPLQVTASGFALPPAFCPDGFSAVIDYPPETA
jgi:hypothetical protein